MDQILRYAIESSLKSKRGFDFEATVNKILLINHGYDNYYPTRERKDNGLDGLIVYNGTVIASYAPDKYFEKKYKLKADEDFTMYIEKWANKYKNWTMFYNNSLAPEQITHCDTLKELAKLNGYDCEVKILGIEQIIQLIESDYNSDKIRKLCEFLNINKEYIIFDYIKSILNDLLSSSKNGNEKAIYKNRIDYEDKVKLNYTERDQYDALEEYQEYIIDGTLKKIKDVFSTFDEDEINAIKMKIKTKFNSFNGTYKEKIEHVLNFYQEKYASERDDQFEYFTRGLLVYCFEQCMIGKKHVIITD